MSIYYFLFRYAPLQHFILLSLAVIFHFSMRKSKPRWVYVYNIVIGFFAGFLVLCDLYSLVFTRELSIIFGIASLAVTLIFFTFPSLKFLANNYRESGEYAEFLETATVPTESEELDCEEDNTEEDNGGECELTLRDVLTDPYNREPIVLINGEGLRVTFNQIATGLWYDDIQYCILQVIDPPEMVVEGEAFVFRIDEEDNGEWIVIPEDNDEIRAAVFEQYEELLAESEE